MAVDRRSESPAAAAEALAVPGRSAAPLRPPLRRLPEARRAGAAGGGRRRLHRRRRQSRRHLPLLLLQHGVRSADARRRARRRRRTRRLQGQHRDAAGQDGAADGHHGVAAGHLRGLQGGRPARRGRDAPAAVRRHLGRDGARPGRRRRGKIRPAAISRNRRPRSRPTGASRWCMSTAICTSRSPMRWPISTRGCCRAAT